MSPELMSRGSPNHDFGKVPELDMKNVQIFDSSFQDDLTPNFRPSQTANNFGAAKVEHYQLRKEHATDTSKNSVITDTSFSFAKNVNFEPSDNTQPEEIKISIETHKAASYNDPVRIMLAWSGIEYTNVFF
jgi:hypothetical protein